MLPADVRLREQFEETSFEPWQIPDWDALSDEEKRFNARRMQTYAGMLDTMDQHIGRLLAHLDATGEADDTLIVFLSDNGPDPNQLPYSSPEYGAWYAEHYDYTKLEDYQGDYAPMGQAGAFADYGPGWAAAAGAPTSYYKTFSSEGGLRVPFIAHFPGKIPAGEISTSFGFVNDVVPTLLQVAGVPVPEKTYRGRTIHTRRARACGRCSRARRAGCTARTR